VGTEVTLGGAGRSGRGYLSEPARPGPGVLFVPDRSGLTAEMRARCDWLAEAGFVALAVDVHGGERSAVEQADPQAETVRGRGLLAVAATQLRGRPKLRPLRVGAVGLGAGGRLALLAAGTGTLHAAVSYYSVLPFAERTLLPCPVLLHLVGRPGDQAEEARGFIRDLRRSGTEVTVRTWSGMAAGFADPVNPAYVESTTIASWVETTGFLAEHLRR
jgi:carboxymethylenebutenolidase